MWLSEFLTESDSQYITMYHGGRDLEYNYRDILGNKSKQIVHGVGLYLISDINIAAKFAKGGNKLYRVTFEKGTRSDEAMISREDCLGGAALFVPASKRKEFMADIDRTINRRGTISVENFSNLILNFEYLKPSKTAAFRQWMMDHGADYAVSRNYGGSHNTMVILINPKKIRDVEIIKWGDLDKDEYHLDVTV